jgi:hypothetical protein
MPTFISALIRWSSTIRVGPGRSTASLSILTTIVWRGRLLLALCQHRPSSPSATFFIRPHRGSAVRCSIQMKRSSGRGSVSPAGRLCRMCTECEFGCQFGAKNTLDFNYLTQAMMQRQKKRAICRGGIAFAVG